MTTFGGGYGFRPIDLHGMRPVTTGIAVSLAGWTASSTPAPAPVGGARITLQDWTGWIGGYSVATESAPSPNGDGTIDGPGRIGARIVTLSGAVMADPRGDSAAVERAGDQLSGLLAGSTRAVELRVSQPAIGLERVIGVRLADSPEFDIVAPWHAIWSLSLHAEDPLRYSVGSWRFDLGQTLDVPNVGNALSRPMLDFYGPLVNPWFEKDGYRFTLRTSIPAGQVLTANCRTRRVTQNGVQTFTPVTAQWPHLKPGAVERFTFGADSGSGHGEIRRSSAWM